MSREALRKQLIRNTEESERAARDPDYIDRERLQRQEKRSDIFACFMILTVFALAVLFYFRNYTFTTYALDEVSFVRGSRTARLYDFSEGTVMIENDAVSYFTDAGSVFATTIAVKDPAAAFCGDYFAFYDRGGYQVYVCDASGVLSTVKVSRKILGIDISATGVTAVFTESNDAAYISYFDRFGNRLPVEVKTVLNASGYPVHISISPDGQKLIALFYSTENGIGESRLVFYDFENGREENSYVMAAFEDYYSTNTFLIDAKFMDDTHAVVIGDNQVSFLTYTEKHTVENRRRDFQAPVRSVLFTDSFFLTVEESKTGNLVNVYNAEGETYASFYGPDEYDVMTADDRYLVFGEKERLYFYNLSGRKRYEGSLVEAPVSLAFSGEQSILVNTGSLIDKITFK